MDQQQSVLFWEIDRTTDTFSLSIIVFIQYRNKSGREFPGTKVVHEPLKLSF